MTPANINKAHNLHFLSERYYEAYQQSGTPIPNSLASAVMAFLYQHEFATTDQDTGTTWVRWENLWEGEDSYEITSDPALMSIFHMLWADVWSPEAIAIREKRASRWNNQPSPRFVRESDKHFRLRRPRRMGRGRRYPARTSAKYTVVHEGYKVSAIQWDHQ